MNMIDVVLYIKNHHYLYSTSSQRLVKVILALFLIIAAILVIIVIYINNMVFAQSNVTGSVPGSTIQNNPSLRPPNIARPPVPNNQAPAAPAITAPPRPTIIAPSNFTASTITSEIEGGNTTISQQTNGSMFLGAPS
jgi:beta-lactamase regulating signal transducer with metallopeptidase domain